MKKTKKVSLFLIVLAVIISLNIVSAAARNKGVSDADYANFRNVKAGRIGQNNLYRSQHPANGSNRSIYANKLAEKNGVRTVLNLSDSKSKLEKYFKEKNIPPWNYYRILYTKGRVYTAHLKVKHKGSSYRKKVAACLRFMVKNKGPYLVHCEVGRDRTGFVILLLECLMGASYSYMVNDFVKTYVNVNGNSWAKAKKNAVKRIDEELSYITGKSKKTDWNKVNLVKSAENYLKKGGMTAKEITALKMNLSVSYPGGGVNGK